MASKAKAAPIAKVRGITEMTKEKHKFDGYAVRYQKGGYAFRKYVPYGGRADARPLPQRMADAHASAVSQHEELVEIVTNPKSWSAGALTKTTLKTIRDTMGFVAMEPEAVA